MPGVGSFDVAVVCSAAASCRAAAKPPACADGPLPVAMLDGELLGEGDGLLEVLDEVLGDGDGLGDGDELDDVLGVAVGLALPGGDGDLEPARQLAAAMAE